MANSLQKFKEVTNGKDATVSITISTLSLLIDNSTMPKQQLDEIVNQTIEVLKPKVSS